MNCTGYSFSYIPKTDNFKLNRMCHWNIQQKNECIQKLDLSSFFKCGTCSLQAADFIETAETKKIVLIHGEGFGAWCWYKSISLLEESGLLPTALDLLGSGIDRTDADSISTLADYAKPLTDYLHNLPEGEKVSGKEQLIIVLIHL